VHGLIMLVDDGRVQRNTKAASEAKAHAAISLRTVLIGSTGCRST
jgi:hypothetical protein